MGNLPSVTVPIKEERRPTSVRMRNVPSQPASIPAASEEDEPPPAPTRAISIPSSAVSTARQSSPPNPSAQQHRRRKRGPGTKYSWAVEVTRTQTPARLSSSPSTIAMSGRPAVTA